jgi:hypothetical protein
MFQRSSIGSSGATEWQGGAGQSGLAASGSDSGCSLPECIEPGRKSEGDQNIISCLFSNLATLLILIISILALYRKFRFLNLLPPRFLCSEFSLPDCKLKSPQTSSIPF